MISLLLCDFKDKCLLSVKTSIINPKDQRQHKQHQGQTVDDLFDALAWGTKESECKVFVGFYCWKTILPLHRNTDYLNT